MAFTVFLAVVGAALLHATWNTLVKSGNSKVGSILAMTVAPIALVAALRETSILFAVLIGWLVFGDKMDRLKTTAAAPIITGVVATRL